MTERYDVVARVISQKGTCATEHKVGDEWAIGSKTPQGMCTSAFNAVYPSAWALMFGGAFPWESDPDIATVACPDAENPVVFQLRRLRK